MIVFLLIYLLNFQIKLSIKAQWSEWYNVSNEECKRNCSEPYGSQVVKMRKCKALESSCDGPLSIKSLCYIPHQCENYGSYTGVYGDWVLIKECHASKEVECKNGSKIGFIDYRRDCLATLKTSELEKRSFCLVKCEKERSHWEQWGRWECNHCTHDSSTAIRHRICGQVVSYCKKDENGYYHRETGYCGDVCKKEWSKWSEWFPNSCPPPDKCWESYQYRRRECEGYGKECVCFYEDKTICSEQYMLCPHWTNCTTINGSWSDWSNWSACTPPCGLHGIKRRTRLCNNPQPTIPNGTYCVGIPYNEEKCDSRGFCPIDGEWSPWSSWYYSFTCGNGYKTRTRKCNNPPPMYTGQYCPGSNYEYTKQINCWFEIIQSINDKIERYLSETTFNYLKKEGDSIVFTCNDNLVKSYSDFYKDNNIEWHLNGEIIKIDVDTISYERSSLLISYLTYEHSGTYHCTIGTNRTVIGIYTVQVLVKHVTDQETRKMNCKEEYVSKYTTRQTRIIWYFNYPKIYDDNNKSEIVILKPPDQFGTFMCILYDDKTKRWWITFMVQVKYKGTISVWDSNKLLIVTLVIVPCLLFIVLIGIVIHRIELKQEAIEQMAIYFIKDFSLKNKFNNNK